tara:strand:+ start:735 stop:1238 length:504 start_codon:yes stop_codon:yes gene_type:complete
MEKTKLFFIVLLFVLGIYFIYKSVITERKLYEAFTEIGPDECPNILIEENSKLYLYNSKKSKIPGVNPIVFNNLEEYVEFLQFQRNKNIRCPVLELRKSYTTQGEENYVIKSSNPNMVADQNDVQVSAPVQKLLDASRDDPPYNDNSYPGYDKENMYVGVNTPLNNI